MKKIRESSVIRNVGKLVLGSGVGQLITLAAAPLIARQYGPQSFGEQSALFAIAVPMAAITSFAFPLAIIVARSDHEALILSRLAFLSSLVFATVVSLSYFLIDMQLFGRLGLADIGALALLLPVIVVLTTMNLSSGYIMARSGSYSLSAWSSVTAAALSNSSKISLGLAWPDALSLIAGNILGYVIGPILSWRLRTRMAAGARIFSLARMKEVARSYRDFALFRAPQNFVATISQSLPVVSLTAAFGAEMAGFYAMALAIAGAPMALIGNAAQSVLYPRLTEASRSGEDVVRLFLRSTVALLMAGLPFVAMIVALGPWLFSSLLGPEWQEAGYFSMLIMPWLWIGLANRPAVALIPTLGIQHGLLLYELFGTAAKSAAIFLAISLLDNARWAVGAYAAIGSIAYLILIAWVFRRVARSAKRGTDGETG